MEKFNLTQTGQEVQNILNEATPQSELTAETERAQEAEGFLGEGIQQNADDIDAIEGKIPSAATSENKLTDKEYVDGQIDAEKARAQVAEGTLQSNIDAEEARAKSAEKQNADDIDALEAVVPSGATSENKLATESYVNDAVATSSATFRGTYNLVSDLHLTLAATHANIATALASAIATADNNDFAFVLIPTDAETPTVIGSIERYKLNGTDWAYEYTLNNSGFTQAQWDAINSGITSGDVSKLAALPTNAQLTTLLAGLQSDIDGEEARAKAAELAIQGNIDAEETRAKAAEKQNADDIDSIEAVIPENASSENKVATESEIDSLSAAIEAILLLIPSAATSLNKLADKAYVNSSIATATATFRGTYNLVNDLGLTISATHAQIATALGGAILTANNNDYAFVQIPTSTTIPTEIARTERYKFNGTAWEYEYDLNNSGFTADQWAAINSGITQALVTKLAALPTNAELTTELGTLTSGITTINQKIPSAASQANKLVDTAAMESYIVEVLNVLTISYNVTSIDGHVTFHIEQVDGKITSVTLATYDIASDAALNLKASQADLTALEGRVTTAESFITSHGVRISQNEADIAILQDAYAGLTQSDIIIGSLPGSGVRNKIYRVPGTTSYSDYMWNGSTWVLMATYNNAIDPRPKKASQNLVTSGGVFDNMGALDVSELNATENPHTLAQYVDLSAALAAIPTDYQKGGMSIKFVQSSDNKYVRYNLIASEFTTDTTKWAIDDAGIYVNNPEYVAVWTTKGGKILIAVENDGNIKFGAGVPKQIVEYVEHKVAELNGDIDAIRAFLDGFTDSTLLEYLNNTYGKYIENQEFIDIKADSKGKVIASRDKDGLLHENVGIYTNRLLLGEEGKENLKKELFEGQCIRVGTFNTGNFTATGLENGSEELFLTYRKLLGEAKCDILATQEDKNSPEGSSAAVRDVIYGMYPYFERYGTSWYNYYSFASLFKLYDVQKIDYNIESEYLTHPWFWSATFYAASKPIRIISFHWEWKDNNTRHQQMQQIINYANQFEYVIICGDTNAENNIGGVSQEPHYIYNDYNEWPVFERAGYSLVNMGLFGVVSTYKYPMPDGHPIDNIFVSPNISIRNIELFKKSWMNDHFLLVADLYVQ